ncbi:MAG: hypothetical protein M1825_005668 [Sarcosagium campestre]|nr:MAG: hypothetical protein M1825_005668 [Sarcosagium campestre]
MDGASDSSDGEYKSTSILLGYASKEATEDVMSHLGGTPTFSDPAAPPSTRLVNCKNCNKLPPLLLELDANLPQRFPTHERRLYIFGCRRPTCQRKNGSVRAVRHVRVLATPERSQEDDDVRDSNTDAVPDPPSEVQRGLGESLFGVSSSASTNRPLNPFSSFSSTSTHTNDQEDQSARNPFSSSSSSSTPVLPPLSSLGAKPAQTPLANTFAAALKLSPDSTPAAAENPNDPTIASEPWPSASDLPPAYPSWHLDADFEYLAEEPSPSLSTSQQKLNPTIDDTSARESAAEAQSAYESSHDKTFQQFADRLAQNPEQVLRYEFDGRPLLYSRTDAIGRALSASSSSSSGSIPPCTACGAQRVFEVQLVPGAIVALEDDNIENENGEAIDEGIEWGTVIVAVCSRDCENERNAGWAEEWVGVQWEEKTLRR